MYSIETKNLKKDFKCRDKTVHAVRGIDLKIEKGLVLGFPLNPV